MNFGVDRIKDRESSLMKKSGFFTVSLIAMLAATTARAEIASKAYVEGKVNPVAQDLANHVADTTMHVTTAEKTAWSAKQNALGFDPENVENKLPSTQARSQEILQNDDLYPSVATTQNMITTVTGALTTSVNSKIDKRVAADKDSVMVRDNAGNYVKGTGSDITVATSNGTTTVTVGHATTADSATKATQDASGNVITDTYATKTEAGNKIDKTVTADKNGVIVRNSAGLAMKGTGTDITVSDTGAITVAHATAANSATTAGSATKATQDASGNVITSTYATKDEVSNNYATKNMELNAIPATPSTEGVYVLTAKITGSGSTASTEYYWEDIGR